MNTGAVIAGRFDIERLAGSGGMGQVFRARDRMTGEPVALKVMHGEGRQDVERFAREGVVLSELRHPAIVRYVAHGDAGDGQLYLAMEWLEGEDLEQRLQRAPFQLADVVRLGLHVADALGAAHARSVVHRDIKPSNLFLVGGAVDAVRVLDFGIARRNNATRMATRTGILVGTPGYMAPEQARGERLVDARADVFSLGCVLYECITGAPAFHGEHVMAVLAKVLLEESPRASDKVPDVLPALDALVTEMLSKNPADRPRDGSTVAERLRRLDLAAKPERPRSIPAPAITAAEQRWVSTVLAGSEGTTLDEALAATIDPTTLQSSERLVAALQPLGARVEHLAGGGHVAIVDSRGTATDQAARAARVALTLRGLLEDRTIVVATGRAVMAGRLPVGEAIDRAARLLRETQLRAVRERARDVGIDDVTAGLLDARFDVRGGGAGLVLTGEREAGDPTRRLLGRPSPCVGRERELGVLSGLFDECATERVARAVVLIAPPGTGKSRVRHEFVQKLAARDEPVEIWTGRGDAVGAGSPFALLAQAVRGGAGILDGEPLEVRQRKLRARVGRHVPSDDEERVSVFVGEMIGVEFADETRPALRAARDDPRLMSDRILAAVTTFFTSETDAQSLVLVLEDLHWGDLPTVRVVDELLWKLRDRPFFVLATARPEVNETFGQFWTTRDVQVIRLGALSPRASERLVRAMMGTDVSRETVERLVARADGNAFYLEEMIRAEAYGGRGELPETVLAMVQARLERLEDAARRVLRAASVFGEVFWQGGLGAVLGRAKVAALREQLTILCDAEWIERRASARFPGEEEFAFRHALVREAAYAMLVAEDRTLAHRIAGQWLEAAGEADPVRLAEHFERGGEAIRAARYYRLAGHQALEGNDFDGAIARAERALALANDTDVELAGEANTVIAGACNWRGQFERCRDAASRGLEQLPRGTADWLRCVLALLAARNRLAEQSALIPVAAMLVSTPPNEATRALWVVAAVRCALIIEMFASPGEGRALLDALEHEERTPGPHDALTLAWFAGAAGLRAFLAGDLGAYVRLWTTLADRLEALGDVREACSQRGDIGWWLVSSGSPAAGHALLVETLAKAEGAGLERLRTSTQFGLGLSYALNGDPDRGERMERELLANLQKSGRDAPYARLFLARILFEQKRYDEAGAEFEQLRESAALDPAMRAWANAIHAATLLALGRIAEARPIHDAAKVVVEYFPLARFAVVWTRLLDAEIRLAGGDLDGARDAFAYARDSLFADALKISDESIRDGFVNRLAESVRTFERCRELGIPVEPPPGLALRV